MEANLSSFTKKKKSRESKGIIIKKKRSIHPNVCRVLFAPAPQCKCDERPCTHSHRGDIDNSAIVESLGKSGPEIHVQKCICICTQSNQQVTNGLDANASEICNFFRLSYPFIVQLFFSFFIPRT